MNSSSKWDCQRCMHARQDTLTLATCLDFRQYIVIWEWQMPATRALGYLYSTHSISQPPMHPCFAWTIAVFKTNGHPWSGLFFCLTWRWMMLRKASISSPLADSSNASLVTSMVHHTRNRIILMKITGTYPVQSKTTGPVPPSPRPTEKLSHSPQLIITHWTVGKYWSIVWELSYVYYINIKLFLTVHDSFEKKNKIK